MKAEKLEKFAKNCNFIILLMVVIISGKYGNNRSRTENVTERTQFSKSRSNDLWPWRYRSRSKVITCDTPSHASDHLYQIWKESTQNCRCYRADTIFKLKAEWPCKYRSRSKVITCDTPSDGIWQEWWNMERMMEYGKNASRIVDFFQSEIGKIRKVCEKL